MDADAAAELLTIYVDNAARIIDAHFGVDRAEPAFLSIVSLINEFPALRGEFLHKTRQILLTSDPWHYRPGTPPMELLEYLAHEFRWPEFEQLALERIEARFQASRSLARTDVSDRILSALRPDWEDRDLYLRFVGATSSSFE